MTYIIPFFNFHLTKRWLDRTYIADIKDNKFDYKKYKTHIWDKEDEYGYQKCLYCNLEALIYRNRIFKNSIYTINHYTCDEMIIKSIIE